jgi:hypothetical protein
MTDPLLQLLDGLPDAALDDSRATRIRTRCHAALTNRRQRQLVRPSRTTRFWTPIVAGVSGLYMIEVVHKVLAVYGL